METTFTQAQCDFVNDTKATAETLIKCLNGISANAGAISEALEELNKNLSKARTLYAKIESAGFDESENIKSAKGLILDLSLCSVPKADADAMDELSLNAKDASQKVRNLIDTIIDQLNDYDATKVEAESEG